jgi:hypothetical protein
VTCEPAGAGSLLCALAAAPESKTIPEIAVTSAESIRMRLSMGDASRTQYIFPATPSHRCY